MGARETITQTRPGDGPATTLQEQAYEFVKAQIMNLDLKPGQYIADSQVAVDMGISRTPVREALRRLEQRSAVWCWPSFR